MKEKIQCELNQKLWGAITHNKVLTANKKYKTVDKLVKHLVDSGAVCGAEIAIVTQDVIDRMLNTI